MGGKKKKFNSMLQSDNSISLIKFDLVFDEKIEGGFLRQHVLSKIDEQLLFDEIAEEEEMQEDNDDEHSE